MSNSSFVSDAETDTTVSGLDIYSSSDHLPRYLGDPLKGHSYEVETTPWQDAVGTCKPRWEWLEEKAKVYHLRDGKNGSDGSASAYPGIFGPELENALQNESKTSCISRPEHAIFSQAMVGGGRVFGQAQLHGAPSDHFKYNSIIPETD
jgi:hypothetical protein